MDSSIAWLGGQLAGVIVIAALVNAFARAHRPRLRRVVTLFVLYAGLLSVSFVVSSFDAAWADRFYIGADLFRVISIINMSGMLLFLIVLPAISIRLPTIAGDLFIGVCYIVATIVVLTSHDIDPSSVIAGGAIASAVMAISLQATLGNILGGIALQMDGSISEGDYIQVDAGRHGRVRAVRWRHTIVDTPDDITIIVPNAQLLANNITVLMPHQQHRLARLEIRFAVALRHAPAQVIRLVTEGLRRSPIDNVAGEPRPSCVCLELERWDGVAVYAARYHAVDVSRRDDSDSLVRARVHAILLREGIPLTSKEQAPVSEAHGRLEALRAVSLFQSCTEDELQSLAEEVSVVGYAAGEVILRQGTIAKWLYVMRSGTVEVRARYDSDGSGPAPEQVGVVATLTAPDFFGEMGLLTGELRNADVIASTDVECLRIGREEITHLMEKRPEFASELSERLATRRLALEAVHSDLDEASRSSRHERERERIRDGIMRFFGM